MYKSCKYLEEALYVAPNEIRACCQRFFYDGKMRGDAKLLDIVENKTPKASDIAKARKKITKLLCNRCIDNSMKKLMKCLNKEYF